MRTSRKSKIWHHFALIGLVSLLPACEYGPAGVDGLETALEVDAMASACAPEIRSGEVAALYAYADCDGTWRLRATAGGGRASYTGVIASDKPLTVTPHALEDHDLLDASNPKQVSFRLTMNRSFLDGLDIKLPQGAEATLTLQQGGPLLVGKSAQRASSPLVLVPVSTGVVLYKADWEKATQTGPMSTSPTAPTTMADYDEFVHFNNSDGHATVVNRPVRQGKFAGRIFLGDNELSGAGDTNRSVHRHEIALQTTEQNYGKTRWIAWSLLMPTDGQFDPTDTAPFEGDSSCHSQIVWRNPTHPYTKYIVSFYLMAKPSTPSKPHGNWTVAMWGGPCGDSGDDCGHSYGFGDAERGKWHDFLLEFKPHKHDQSARTYLRWRKEGGVWQTAIDDRVANVSEKLLEEASQSLVFKSGSYRHLDRIGDQVIYVDGPWIGTTEASVLPFFNR